jgi:hypothetical protein
MPRYIYRTSYLNALMNVSKQKRVKRHMPTATVELKP